MCSAITWRLASKDLLPFDLYVNFRQRETRETGEIFTSCLFVCSKRFFLFRRTHTLNGRCQSVYKSGEKIIEPKSIVLSCCLFSHIIQIFAACIPRTNNRAHRMNFQCTDEQRTTIYANWFVDIAWRTYRRRHRQEHRKFTPKMPTDSVPPKSTNARAEIKIMLVTNWINEVGKRKLLARWSNVFINIQCEIGMSGFVFLQLPMAIQRRHCHFMAALNAAPN